MSPQSFECLRQGVRIYVRGLTVTWKHSNEAMFVTTSGIFNVSWVHRPWNGLCPFDPTGAWNAYIGRGYSALMFSNYS